MITSSLLIVCLLSGPTGINSVSCHIPHTVSATTIQHYTIRSIMSSGDGLKYAGR